MLFNSCQFLIFFLLVTGLFYFLPHALRWPMLLGASCYFYAVFVPKYLLILFLIIGIDYCAGIFIERSSGTRRKVLLATSIFANLGVLAFFKYGGFAESEINRLATLFGLHPIPDYFHYVLPIGLSFHTFQSISYTVEVYRRNQKAETNLGIYALYVMFYPQMVAGPIERPQNILPQLHEVKKFDASNFTLGLSWMVWGAFKKIIIADNLTLLVDAPYANPEQYHGWPIVIATYAFALQIYCDFSGYSDIARGAALAMGYRLMKNFDIPYHASSVSEFWRRWHISLSTWFRDYLFIPLGGSRKGTVMTYRNLMIVFIVSGLWHGASWAFVIWGGLHGTILILELATQRLRDQVWSLRWLSAIRPARPVIAVLITFHLVVVAWVFFRAGSLDRAVAVIKSCFSPSPSAEFPDLNFTSFQWLGLALCICVMEGVHLTRTIIGKRSESFQCHGMLRIPLILIGAFAILLWGRFDTKDFIYFQF